MLRAWRRGGVEVWISGAWEANAADLGTWRHGGLEAYCRCADVEAHRYEGLEVRCRRVDVEMLRSAAGVQAWGCRRMELRSSSVLLLLLLKFLAFVPQGSLLKPLASPVCQHRE